MSGHYVLPSNNPIGGNLIPNQAHTMNNRPMNAFTRDGQNQQSLRMNQMMAPSMPNIAHSNSYATNMQASQSMQNVNMIHPNYYVQSLQQQNNANQAMNATFANGYSADMPKIQEMDQAAAEMARRRHMQQRQQQDIPMYSLDVNVHSAQNSMPNLSSNSMLLSPVSNPNDISNNFRLNSTLTKNHSSQPGINYMQNASMGPNLVKQLPPTAPKPQLNRSQQQNKDDLSPPLPPSATHPLFKTVNTSLNSPNTSYNTPNTNYYLTSSTLPKSFMTQSSSNPWEREEREKEHEIRREQGRQWREHHIIELSTLPHRTPQQEEQLKTLILERDFERLAQEQGDLEEDNDTNYGKDNIQEVIRLTQNANQLSTPVTSMKQIDVKTNIVSQASYTNATGNETHGLNDSNFGTLPPQSQQQQLSAGSQQSSSSHVQPKSILKHNNARVERTNTSNPSSPSKQAKSTTFADDRQNSDQNSSVAAISNVVRDLNNMSFSDYDTKPSMNTVLTSNYQIKEINEANANALNSSMNGPPPPPERNSSYVIMSQKQQSLRNNNLNLSITNQTVKKSNNSTVAMTNANTESKSTIGQFMISNKKPIANSTTTNNNNVNNSNSINSNHSMNNNDSNNNSTNNSNINGSGVSSGTSNNNINSSIVNNNTNHINDSNTSSSSLIINNNVISSNSVTSPSVQSTANLSLAAMMAQRDNKRVSFHDEENNLLVSSTSSIGDQAELSIVREDPNVRKSFVCPLAKKSIGRKKIICILLFFLNYSDLSKKHQQYFKHQPHQKVNHGTQMFNKRPVLLEPKKFTGMLKTKTKSIYF